MNKKAIIAVAGLLGLSNLSFAQMTPEPAFRIRFKHVDSICASYRGKSFPLFDFKTITGNNYSSKNTQGKVVFIHFWKVGCPPCRAEIDGLNKMYARLKNNLDFVFLSVIDEDPSKLQVLLKERNIHIDYPVVCLAAKQIAGYNFNWGFPTNLIVDKKGKIAFFKTGGWVDKMQAEAEIRKVFVKKIEELL